MKVTKKILVDFESDTVGNILGKRFFSTAQILGLRYKYESSPYGDPVKYHYVITITGDPDHIERFIDFVDEALSHTDDSAIAKVFDEEDTTT